MKSNLSHDLDNGMSYKYDITYIVLVKMRSRNLGVFDVNFKKCYCDLTKNIF